MPLAGKQVKRGFSTPGHRSKIRQNRQLPAKLTLTIFRAFGGVAEVAVLRLPRFQGGARPPGAPGIGQTLIVCRLRCGYKLVVSPARPAVAPHHCKVFRITRCGVARPLPRHNTQGWKPCIISVGLGALPRSPTSTPHTPHKPQRGGINRRKQKSRPNTTTKRHIKSWWTKPLYYNTSNVVSRAVALH